MKTEKWLPDDDMCGIGGVAVYGIRGIANFGAKSQESKRHRDRAIACVNACAGIKNPEALPDVVDLLGRMDAFLSLQYLPPMGPEAVSIQYSVKEVLAKLEGY